jgi:hypothetical protein
MRAVAFILATCALLPAASAGAGQCTTEIDNLAICGPVTPVPAQLRGQPPSGSTRRLQ